MEEVRGFEASKLHSKSASQEIFDLEMCMLVLYDRGAYSAKGARRSVDRPPAVTIHLGVRRFANTSCRQSEREPGAISRTVDFITVPSPTLLARCPGAARRQAGGCA